MHSGIKRIEKQMIPLALNKTKNYLRTALNTLNIMYISCNHFVHSFSHSPSHHTSNHLLLLLLPSCEGATKQFISTPTTAKQLDVFFCFCFHFSPFLNAFLLWIVENLNEKNNGLRDYKCIVVFSNLFGLSTIWRFQCIVYFFEFYSELISCAMVEPSGCTLNVNHNFTPRSTVVGWCCRLLWAIKKCDFVTSLTTWVLNDE